ncbi:unnamed protein product, partial [Ectocarpus sp. 12 AP-2014]
MIAVTTSTGRVARAEVAVAAVGPVVAAAGPPCLLLMMMVVFQKNPSLPPRLRCCPVRHPWLPQDPHPLRMWPQSKQVRGRSEHVLQYFKEGYTYSALYKQLE